MTSSEAPKPFATEENYHQSYRRGRTDEVDLEALVFTLGTEEYGLDIRLIREIMKLDRTITEVPRAPQFVPGIISVRGEIVPLVDLRLRLHLQASSGGGHRASPDGGVARARSHPGDAETARRDPVAILIVRREPDIFGLMVDSVRHVVRMREEELEAAPPAIGTQGEFVAAIGRPRGDRMIILLNLETVLAFGGPRR